GKGPLLQRAGRGRHLGPPPGKGRMRCAPGLPPLPRDDLDAAAPGHRSGGASPFPAVLRCAPSPPGPRAPCRWAAVPAEAGWVLGPGWREGFEPCGPLPARTPVRLNAQYGRVTTETRSVPEILTRPRSYSRPGPPGPAAGWEGDHGDAKHPPPPP